MLSCRLNVRPQPLEQGITWHTLVVLATSGVRKWTFSLDGSTVDESQGVEGVAGVQS